MVHDRPLRRAKILREAEGYLDLVLVLSDRWSLAPEIRDRVAQRALDALARIEHPGSDRSAVYYLRGMALKAMHRFREAIVPLRRAAALERENIHVFLALGWCYKRIARLDRAIDSLLRALAVDPTAAILYYNLACYFSLVGDKKHALDHLGQALAIDPDYREMIDAEPDFDTLRSDADFQELVHRVIV